jgi:hypothetical protein
MQYFTGKVIKYDLLNIVNVNISKENDKEFFIQFSNKKFKFLAEDEVDRDIWVNDLNNALFCLKEDNLIPKIKSDMCTTLFFGEKV